MASSVAQPLERQFAQIPGITQMTSISGSATSAITVQFDLDRNIDARGAGYSGGDQRRERAAAENLPSPPTYRKINPADAPILLLAVHFRPVPLTEVDDYAENVLAQQISARSPASPRSSSAASRSRRFASRSIRQRSPRSGLRLEDVRSVIVNATIDPPKGTIDGADPDFHDLRQRPDPQGGALERRHRRLSATARRSASAISAAPSTARKTLASRPWQTASRHPAAGLQAAGRQRHRDRRQHQGAPAAAAGGDPTDRQDRRS